MRQKSIYLAIFAIVATITVLYASTYSTTISSSKFAQHIIPHTSSPTSNSQEQDKPKDKHEPQHQDQSQWQEKQWEFKYPRDARNYGLSESQCDAAFPDLYADLERAALHRKNKPITLKELDTDWRGDGIVRAMIWDNQLYIIENRGVWDGNHRPRSVASLHALHRALVAHPDPVPNIEFTITDHDSANMPNAQHLVWSYARETANQEIWLIPDFNFWSWPNVNIRSFAEFTHFLTSGELDFAAKDPRIVWRGSVEVAAKDVRTALLTHAQGKSWSDVRVLDWGNATNVAENLISIDDHCKYMFVAQTEGNTYSGRLKFLLNCASVVVSHDLEFVEHFSHLLQSGGESQNYVKVRRDFEDLEGQIEGMLDGEVGSERARTIAEESRRVFRERYLTPAAEACYWRRLIRTWHKTQGFEVKFWKDVVVEKNGKKTKVRRPRGVPFESYVIMEATEWDIPPKPRKICEYD